MRGWGKRREPGIEPGAARGRVPFLGVLTICALFTSRVLGFVDDVEFYCDGLVIQVRSASRLGYSDLGVNRKRVEEIRRAFAAS